MKTRLRVLLLMAVAGLFVMTYANERAHAQASARSKAKAHTDAGKKAQALGDFDKAIAEYQAAYELVPHHALLFNLGQVYRLKGDKENAVVHYQKFLSIEGEGAAATKARQYVALLNEAIAAEAARKPEPVPEPEPEPEPETAAPVEPVRSDVQAQAGHVVSPAPAPARQAPASTAPARPASTTTSSYSRREPGYERAVYTSGLRLGLGYGPMFQELGDGAGLSLAVGYDFSGGGGRFYNGPMFRKRIGLRLDYGTFGEDDGDNSFLHIGPEYRASMQILRGNVYLGMSVGFTRFSDGIDGDSGGGGGGDDFDSESDVSSGVGAQVSAGFDIVAFNTISLGLGTFYHVNEGVFGVLLNLARY